MTTSWSLEDDPGCIVLRSLQYLDAAGWTDEAPYNTELQ